MTRKDKIEKILKQADSRFAGLVLPQKEVSDKLFEQINSEVTEFEKKRYNIGRDLWQLKLARLASVSLVILLIVLFTGIGLGYAAESTVPGDLFYPVKRKIEATRLQMVQNFEKQSQLKIRFLEKRAQELQKLQLKNGSEK